jgi:hypothetical protein
MSNRLGQFVMPFGAGLIATVASVGGLFVALAVAIVAASGAMLFKRPQT